jgi:triosephosphate isomerase
MKPRGVLLAGNWKMNHGPAAARGFFETFPVSKKSGAKLRIYPSFLALQASLDAVKASGQEIEIGAQNFHSEKSGAFTGEVSGPMLAEIGIRQVLLGHSERRQYFAETPAVILKKTVSALQQGFEVLLCIGETLDERQAGQTLNVLTQQLESALTDATCVAAFGKSLHLAYEPVWAIGTGVTATPAQAQETHASLRALLTRTLGSNTANAVRILYGGSVTPANFAELLACPDIDGGLVGGASLKPDSLSALWSLI